MRTWASELSRGADERRRRERGAVWTISGITVDNCREVLTVDIEENCYFSKCKVKVPGYLDMYLILDIFIVNSFLLLILKFISITEQNL